MECVASTERMHVVRDCPVKTCMWWNPQEERKCLAATGKKITQASLYSGTRYKRTEVREHISEATERIRLILILHEYLNLAHTNEGKMAYTTLNFNIPLMVESILASYPYNHLPATPDLFLSALLNPSRGAFHLLATTGYSQQQVLHLSMDTFTTLREEIKICQPLR